MLKFVFHPAVEKDLRQLSAPVSNILKSKVIPGLQNRSLAGVRLLGGLREYVKFRFTAGGQSYRLVYRLVEPETLFVVGVGKRGEFYQRLRRRIGR